ncbi:MAG: hypothetical protein OEY19_08460 [Gammaproteobacteria bacterium]|nr:hypothetical protein [Gammaproteobacteria bacterium]
MKIKLIVQILLFTVIVIVITENPKLWWLAFAIPLTLMKRKFRSFFKKDENSIYDSEYEKEFSNLPEEKDTISFVHKEESNR